MAVGRRSRDTYYQPLDWRVPEAKTLGWDHLARTWAEQKGKGCDIGYALAANSCEGANNVDACTVTALDATTAFAVPDPNLPLAEPVGFFGSGCSLDRSTEPDHPVYFGSATVYFA